jgi:hypothetical protein
MTEHTEPTKAQYRVHLGYVNGRDRWRYFSTIAAANEFCEKVRLLTRVILTVLSVE